MLLLSFFGVAVVLEVVVVVITVLSCRNYFSTVLCG